MRPVIAFAAACGKVDFLRLGTDGGCYLLAGIFHRSLGIAANAVDGAGVAVMLGKVGEHRVEHFLAHGRGRRVIHIDDPLVTHDGLLPRIRFMIWSNISPSVTPANSWLMESVSFCHTAARGTGMTGRSGLRPSCTRSAPKRPLPWRRSHPRMLISPGASWRSGTRPAHRAPC